MSLIASLDNRESNHAVFKAQHTPEIREERVIAIRRQIGEGRYCIADKLNVVIDRILEDLLTNSN